MPVEEDYTKLEKLAEKVGIVDVVRAYDLYSELVQATYDVLNQLEVDVSYSTTDTSS